MLDLDDARWGELEHAYGRASDIPALLRRLDGLPPSEGKREPWFSLWSALAHQGDSCSAAFAAVPHVVRVLSTAPVRADWVYFGFPAWVEICRQRNQASVPEDLFPAYAGALERLPSLIAAAAAREWNELELRTALSALAAAKGDADVAAAAGELTPKAAGEFLEWHANR